MKNTIRVRRNGGKTYRPSQAKRDEAQALKQDQERIKAEFALPDQEVHPSCLAIFDRSTMTPLRKIPLTEREMFEVFTAATKSGIFAKDYVAAAIREKISPVNLPLHQLEQAMMESNSLIFLLTDKIQLESEKDRALDHYHAGIIALAHAVTTKLDQAVQAVFYANRLRKVEVAA